MKMKKNWKSGFAGILMTLLLIIPSVSKGQNEKAFIKKYLTTLPHNPVSQTLQKYRMTAIYTNRDLYGTFTGKTKISGDYTRGLENSQVKWNNALIAGSNSFADAFPEGVRQEYMEDMVYVPSPEMLKEEAFKNFPANPENVFARNLIWDMMMIEGFAWDYSDSLKLNRKFVLREIHGEFDMADIGTYNQASIELCWTGISEFNNELCAVIEYRALDNIIKISMDQINTKGTEQYWGTTWVSLKTGQIEYAEVYGGTIQEIALKGLSEKFLIKTIRVLWVEKIQ
jgi:hypothetical protein